MPKILVVDDEKSHEDLITQRFTQKEFMRNHEFIFALNGLKALELINSHPDIEIALLDINMPGMMTCFIYDEFHPDAEYENSQKAVDYAIDYVFGKTSFYDHHFAESISFNQHKNLSKMEFNNVVENLKNHYEEITLGHTKATGCTINEMHCAVHGYYEAAITIGGKSRLKKGHWSVSFQLDQESGYWDINDVQIRGVEIP